MKNERGGFIILPPSDDWNDWNCLNDWNTFNL